MIDYTSYDFTDFARDPSFRRWVLEASSGETRQWEQWLRQHPERLETVQKARALVLAVQQRFDDHLTEDAISHEVALILQQARQRPAEADEPAPRHSPFRLRWWQAAAAVFLIAGGGWWYRQYQETTDLPTTYHRLIAEAPVPLAEKHNPSGQAITFSLPDGSVVTLYAGSRLSYPTHFSGARRQVYLTGEASFAVRRNPQQPFLVYANETVTKVLGTEFRIKAFEQESVVTVSVRSGRVSMYASTEFEKLNRPDQTEVQGVVLTPNQRAIFNRRDGRLEKGLVDEPELQLPAAGQPEQVFEDQPVTEVLESLERNYRIDIVFDREVLAHCPITTTFKQETLHQKLNIICHAIGASYEVVDGHIILNSKGCSSETKP